MTDDVYAMRTDGGRRRDCDCGSAGRRMAGDDGGRR
jgi:hypothetical protein